MPDVGSSTARGIVIHNNHILLIERWRDTLHYFTVPGGRVEPGETLEMALVRELLEEASIEVAPLKEVFTLVGGDPEHHIFLCEYVSGEPELQADSEEAADNALGKNKYHPRWVPLNDLPGLELAPSFTKLLLLNALKDGFPDDAQIHVER
jgi:8-oxo-dGTP pyrophosphatase MutT (NUDIX family)